MVNEVLENLIYFVTTSYTMGRTIYTRHYCTDFKLLDSAYLVPDKVTPDQTVYKFS
jgi:hypothetical protein